MLIFGKHIWKPLSYWLSGLPVPPVMSVHLAVFFKRTDGDGTAVWGEGLNQEKWVDYWRAVGRKPEEVIYIFQRGGTVHCVTACKGMGAMCLQKPSWIEILYDPECNAVCDLLWGIWALCCQSKIYMLRASERGSVCGLYFRESIQGCTQTMRNPNLYIHHHLCLDKEFFRLFKGDNSMNRIFLFVTFYICIFSRFYA